MRVCVCVELLLFICIDDSRNILAQRKWGLTRMGFCSVRVHCNYLFAYYM